MTCNNIEEVTEHIVSKQKQYLKYKDNQLTLRFRWLGRYL